MKRVVAVLAVVGVMAGARLAAAGERVRVDLGTGVASRLEASIATASGLDPTSFDYMRELSNGIVEYGFAPQPSLSPARSPYPLPAMLVACGTDGARLVNNSGAAGECRSADTKEQWQSMMTASTL